MDYVMCLLFTCEACVYIAGFSPLIEQNTPVKDTRTSQVS